MAKEYTQNSMWLVHYGNATINKALFDTKEAAEEFAEMMKEKGVYAGVNVWMWDVLIER